MMAWRFWKTQPPQCGTEPPQCGEPAPQSGATRKERAEEALAALEATWANAKLRSPHGDDWSPKRLALEFRNQLQARPDLVGMGIISNWVRTIYPLFARAQGVAIPPAYRLFAEELARLVPRRREDIREGGKRRCTVTLYRVPDPVSAVVKLAAKRA